LTWAQVLVIALAAIGLYVIELVTFMRAVRRQAQQEQLTRARLDALSAELTAAREKVDALGQALDDIRRGPKTSGQYREAVEMAERGLDSAALAENCGISRAEADLIVALYRARAA
jgi:type II secretory pathway pseudopilin PulG